MSLSNTQELLAITRFFESEDGRIYLLGRNLILNGPVQPKAIGEYLCKIEEIKVNPELDVIEIRTRFEKAGEHVDTVNWEISREELFEYINTSRIVH